MVQVRAFWCQNVRKDTGTTNHLLPLSSSFTLFVSNKKLSADQQLMYT